MMAIPTFCKTITVLNRLTGATRAQADTWHKAIINNASWITEASRVPAGSSVSIAESFICRIPKDSRYAAYEEWAKRPAGGFTLSPGDYIFLGTVKENITADNLISVLKSYRGKVLQIKSVRDNTGFPLSPHYKVVGV